MKKNITMSIFLLSFLLLTCGPEILIIYIPAITAIWCVEDDPCHKFEFRPDTISNENRFEGVVGGLEYYINPADGNTYKDPAYKIEGTNFIIGAFENLNIAFTVQERNGVVVEREYLGAMEVDRDSVRHMVLESLSGDPTLKLIRPPAYECKCE